MYVGVMTDHVSILRSRIEKAESKVQRYQKSLESANNELSDLFTALRVIEGIENSGDSGGTGTITTMGRQLDIVKILGVGRENAQPPVDIYATYSLVCNENIKIDTFRTTIWRMKDQVFEVDGQSYIVYGESGNYWKEGAADHANMAPPLQEGSNYPSFEENEGSWDPDEQEAPF